MISSLEKGAIFVNVKKKIIKGNIDNKIKKADMAPNAATWSSLHFFKKSIASEYKFLIRFNLAIDIFPFANNFYLFLHHKRSVIVSLKQRIQKYGAKPLKRGLPI